MQRARQEGGGGGGAILLRATHSTDAGFITSRSPDALLGGQPVCMLNGSLAPSGLSESDKFTQ